MLAFKNVDPVPSRANIVMPQELVFYNVEEIGF
jgi:hypothetical protein